MRKTGGTKISFYPCNKICGVEESKFIRYYSDLLRNASALAKCYDNNIREIEMNPIS